MLTDGQVAAIAARLKAATPGPWHAEQAPFGGGSECDEVMFTAARGITFRVARCLLQRPGQATADAAFIAHAREDIPALLAERAALLEMLRLARAECQWREARETAAMGIVQAVARAMVICGHAPEPDYLCPHFADGKAWPLRTKARALLGLSWMQEPKP